MENKGGDPTNLATGPSMKLIKWRARGGLTITARKISTIMETVVISLSRLGPAGGRTLRQ